MLLYHPPGDLSNNRANNVTFIMQKTYAIAEYTNSKYFSCNTPINTATPDLIWAATALINGSKGVLRDFHRLARTWFHAPITSGGFFFRKKRKPPWFMTIQDYITNQEDLSIFFQKHKGIYSPPANNGKSSRNPEIGWKEEEFGQAVNTCLSLVVCRAAEVPPGTAVRGNVC